MSVNQERVAQAWVRESPYLSLQSSCANCAEVMEALTAFSSATKSGTQIAGLGGGDSHAELRGRGGKQMVDYKAGYISTQEYHNGQHGGRKTQDGRR
jgi:hypothetical protein